MNYLTTRSGLRIGCARIDRPPAMSADACVIQRALLARPTTSLWTRLVRLLRRLPC